MAMATVGHPPRGVVVVRPGVSIRRPRAGRLEVRLPYAADGENYRLLRHICGKRTRPEWSASARAFVVARSHFDALVRGLAIEYGAVAIRLEGFTRQVCTESCRTARSSVVFCVCSCGSLNHNSGSTEGRVVGYGRAGAVYLKADRVVRDLIVQRSQVLDTSAVQVQTGGRCTLLVRRTDWWQAEVLRALGGTAYGDYWVLFVSPDCAELAAQALVALQDGYRGPARDLWRRTRGVAHHYRKQVAHAH